LETEHLSLYTVASQGEPGMGESFTGDSDRHVKEGFGSGILSLYKRSVKGT